MLEVGGADDELVALYVELAAETHRGRVGEQGTTDLLFKLPLAIDLLDDVDAISAYVASTMSQVCAHALP